ncbi:MAG: permease-like cell division protein FtsX [Marmoricola sp.]
MTTFRYVFAEASLGLRRNLSMAISLVVTIFVSLTLVGLGLLVSAQAHRAEQSLGSQLTIQAYLCNDLSLSSNCSKQNVTPAQKQAVVGVLRSNAEVKSFQWQSKQQAYNLFRQLYASDKAQASAYAAVTPADMQESYIITLKDPRQYKDVESQLQGMPGVDNVHDLHNQLGALYRVLSYLKWGAIITAGILLVAAVFQVVNTIRLATMARRREIGIMRLVGASSLYISLPFLMEILVAAAIGVVLAGAALAGFTQFIVYDKIRDSSHIMTWVNWTDFSNAFIWLAALGVILTMIPTLFVTRRYLKV